MASAVEASAVEASAVEPGAIEPSAIEPFVRMALGCTEQAYPNQIAHRLDSDADARLPRELTPVFYGCYDWHSAVHGHWLIARAARVLPGSPISAPCRAQLERSLTVSGLEAEHAYLSAHPGFERPYGLAWLLTLHLELHEWAHDDPQAASWSARLAPLAGLAAERFDAWLPKLLGPTRSGTHAQTAFSLGLAIDWAARLDSDRATAWKAQAVRLHGGDRDLPAHLEPAGEDFLSGSLGAADLMRRVLSADDFAAWLERALPDFGSIPWRPVKVSDAADGRLAHLDGLNLSRAFQLAGIAAALPAGPTREAALSASNDHREFGISETLANAKTHYAGSHWLGSFAMYLLTERGLRPH